MAGAAAGGDEQKEKVAPKVHYFVSVDGTDAVDSAQFGLSLQSFAGWRSLYDEFLSMNKSPDDPARLVDPNHDYLPIWKVVRSGATSTPEAKKGTAVVCPVGLNSKAKDKFLASYKGSQDWGGFQTDGIWTALERSAAAIESWILNPAVVVDTAARKAWIDDDLGPNPYRPELTRIAPEIVQVSSHGWLGGFMGSNAVTRAKDDWFPKQYWFLVGRVEKKGLAFEGPVWLILAQCSTVCQATWPSWVKILGRSKPPVRGVIAYEEVAPAAGEAANIYVEFFDLLSGKGGRKPLSFIEAWQAVNTKHNRHWAAIVHKNALGDGLHNWDQQPPLGETGTTDTLSSYHGFSHTSDGRIDKDITIEPVPFQLELARVDAGKRYPVHAWNLDGFGAVLEAADPANPGRLYEVRVSPNDPSSEGPLASARLEWVHIRASKPPFVMSGIFVIPTSASEPDVVVTYDKVNVVTLKATGAKKPTSLTVKFLPVSQAQLGKIVKQEGAPDRDDRIEAHHSYFWLRVKIELQNGATHEHDFTTQGLLFYG